MVCPKKETFSRESSTVVKQSTYSIEDSEGLVSNPKELFNVINFKRKLLKIPNSMTLNNSTRTNIQNICELFADYFESVYSEDCRNSSVQLPRKHKCLVNIEFTRMDKDEVFKCLSRIKIKKSVGPNFVPLLIPKHMSLH